MKVLNFFKNYFHFLIFFSVAQYSDVIITYVFQQGFSHQMSEEICKADRLALPPFLHDSVHVPAYTLRL